MLSYDPPRSAAVAGDIIPRGDAGTHRYLAAVADQVLGGLLALLVAKMVPETSPMAQGITAIVVYFAYFFLLEGMFGATAGKWFFGLRVFDQRGGKCSWGQSAVRTLLRVVEVNPVTGALPAGLMIVFSRRKRRLGDILAGTIVVSPEAVREWQASQRLPRNCEACGEPVESSLSICPLCGGTL